MTNEELNKAVYDKCDREYDAFLDEVYQALLIKEWCVFFSFFIPFHLNTEYSKKATIGGCFCTIGFYKYLQLKS